MPSSLQRYDRYLGNTFYSDLYKIFDIDKTLTTFIIYFISLNIKDKNFSGLYCGKCSSNRWCPRQCKRSPQKYCSSCGGKGWEGTEYYCHYPSKTHTVGKCNLRRGNWYFFQIWTNLYFQAFSFIRMCIRLDCFSDVKP